MKAPQTRRLSDPDAETMRRSHEEAIRSLQAVPAVSMRVIKAVSLPDATEVVVSHGLGREPIWIGPSCLRGPSTSGRIEEILTGAHDRTRFVKLKASGFGATVTIDLAVL